MTETIGSVTTTDAVLDEDAQRDLTAQMVKQAGWLASTSSALAGC